MISDLRFTAKEDWKDAIKFQKCDTSKICGMRGIHNY